jgi:hypothetical protein
VHGAGRALPSPAMTLAYRSGDDLPELAPALEARLRAELALGERVLWKGTPAVGAIFRRSLPLFLFMFAWISFAVFWTTQASRKGAHMGFFGSLFIAFGVFNLYKLARPLLVARSTVYAVTTRRALTIDPSVVSSHTRAMMTDLTRSSDRGGRCDLIFAQRPAGSGRRTVVMPVGFLGITNGKEVERLIREEMSQS